MKRIEIIIPHRMLADAHGILKEVNVGGMSHYRIEGSGRVKPQPVTGQRGTSQTQPEYAGKAFDGGMTKIDLVMDAKTGKWLINFTAFQSFITSIS
jgi:nitrogen regulatory protein PII